MELAARSAKPGTVVLLSPGGTSYDAYKDFEARGQHFIALVEQYSGLVNAQQQSCGSGRKQRTAKDGHRQLHVGRVLILLVAYGAHLRTQRAPALPGSGIFPPTLRHTPHHNNAHRSLNHRRSLPHIIAVSLSQHRSLRRSRTVFTSPHIAVRCCIIAHHHRTAAASFSHRRNIAAYIEEHHSALQGTSQRGIIDTYIAKHRAGRGQIRLAPALHRDGHADLRNRHGLQFQLPIQCAGQGSPLLLCRLPGRLDCRRRGGDVCCWRASPTPSGSAGAFRSWE